MNTRISTILEWIFAALLIGTALGLILYASTAHAEPGHATVSVGEYRAFGENFQKPYTLGVLNSFFAPGLVTCPDGVPTSAAVVRATLTMTGTGAFADTENVVGAIISILGRQGCRWTFELPKAKTGL